MKVTYAFEYEKIEYCGQCPCYNDDGGGCMLGYHPGWHGWHKVEADTPKPEDCPLVEV